MKAKITKRLVDLQETSDSDQFVWDTAQAGFGLKITPKGRKVYIFQYRNKVTRNLKRLTIGVHGDPWSPESARTEASILKGQVEGGGDPVQARKDEKEIAAQTVKELCEKYLTEYAEGRKKPISIRDDKNMIGRFILPELGKKPIVTVTEKDVSKLHNKLKGTPFQANRVVALLSTMFTLAETPWGLRDRHTNPCKSVKRYDEGKTKRRRFLTADELKALGKTLASAEKKKDASPYSIAAIRLLLFTGARLNEILTMKWEHVHLDLGEVHLPESKTGFKTLHLAAPALAILSDLDKVEGCPYVIVGGRRRKGPETGQFGHLVNLEKTWLKIRREAKIEDVRLHDLRHTFASVGAASGFGLPVIGAILGHKSASTTNRYAHLGDDPLKVATSAVAARIDDAMGDG